MALHSDTLLVTGVNLHLILNVVKWLSEAQDMPRTTFANPFRPGAGHMPPYLAGRQKEKEEFLRLSDQDLVLENMVLTGLRGVGKTVLLDTLKPLAIQPFS